MDVKIVVLCVVVVAALLIYYRPLGSLWFVKKKCTGTVEGHYVYTEGYWRSNGVGGGESMLVPAYEYTVGEKLYMVTVEGMEQTYNVFPLEVEVKYNPANPEVCFVNGKRGMIVKKR